MPPTRATIPIVLFLCATSVLFSACSDEPGPSETDASPTAQNDAQQRQTDRAGARTENVETRDASPVDPELCGEDKDEPSNGETTPLDLPTPESSEVIIEGFAPDPSIGAPNTLSNAGEYRVTLESVGEIRVGEPFEIVARIEYADGTMLPSDVTASADAYMPKHFHGMNVTTKTTRTGDWEYTARTMAFHMTGVWEVYIDVSELGVTERAQFTFEVK